MSIRLLVVSPSMARGGAQRFGATLLARLDRSRFAPELAIVRNDVGFPLPEDVPVHRLGYNGAITGLGVIQRLAQLIADTRPEVLLSTLASANIITGCALRLCGWRPRWVARLGANPKLQDDPARKLLHHALVRQAHAFVANSERMRVDMESVYPFTRGKSIMIHNPADFEMMDTLAGSAPVAQANSGRPIILAVGRLQPDKRPDLLLEVLAHVRKSVDAELWIAGDGNLELSTRQQIADLGLADHVKLLGFQQNPFALMRQASVMLLTSDYEGLPNALIEAQGLGVCAVATRSGAAEVVEDGVTGLLAPMGDVRALGDATVSLLKDDALRARMGEAARLRCRELFDVTKIMPLWEKLLEGVAHPNGGAAR